MRNFERILNFKYKAIQITASMDSRERYSHICIKLPSRLYYKNYQAWKRVWWKIQHINHYFTVKWNILCWILKKKEENFSVLDQCMGKKRYSRHFWFSFILYLQQQTKHVIQSYFDIYFQEREMWEIPVSYSNK